MKFVDVVVAIVGLIGRMRDINMELTKRLAYLTRKRPRSESLERLERQLTLPLFGVALTAAVARPVQTDPAPPKVRKRSPRAGGRGTFPAEMERLRVVNPSRPASALVPFAAVR